MGIGYMELKESIRNTSTIYILFCNFLFTISLGIAMILFPLILKNNGYGEFFIGISAAVELLAGITVAPYISRFSHKISTHKLTAIFTLINIPIILIIPFFVNYGIWLIYIAIIGISWFSYFSLSQAIINLNIGNKNRSFIISCSTNVFCLGLIIGSIIIRLIGNNTYIPYIICATLYVTIVLILIHKVKPLKESSSQQQQQFRYFIRKKPKIFLARFFQQYISHTIFLFIVIYGINNGFTAKNSALLITSFALSAIFDLFLGYMLDKINRIRILNITIIISTILMFNIYYFATEYIIILGTLFILGIASGLMYIGCSSEINRFNKADLIAANSCYSMVGNIGGMSSALITGFMLQTTGNIGIFIPIFIIAICYFSLNYYNKN